MLRKSISLLLALLLTFALCACGGSENDSEPSGTPTVSPAGTKAPDPTPTPEPSTVLQEAEDAGQEYIDKLTFIGDSTTYGLKYYGVLPGGKSTTKVWTPASGTLALFNQSIATVVYPQTGEEITIVDAVSRAKPEYLVLTIGVNGVSMMEEGAFKNEYTDLIGRIQAASPGTKIICNSIYPVEASYEAKGNGINNEVISRANIWICAIAEQTGTRYCNSASVLTGADGCLISEFGNGDGIHLDADGFNAVLAYMRTHPYK